MSERPSRRSTARKEVLVVEDDTAIADMLIMLLEGEGYHVTWVDSAPAALQLLCQPASADTAAPAPRPDVILLDLLLPGMDGAEMARQLSQKGQTMPPCIVMSAKSHQAVDNDAVSIGAAGVIHKPFHIEALLDSIDQVLSQPH